MTNLTLGIYTSHNDAELAITQLVETGIKQTDISYLFIDKKGDLSEGQTGDKMTAGAVTGGAAGAIIGGIAGIVVANGILPGIGTFFVAGPLATALGLTGVVATTAAGAATGAAAGGIIGALMQLGVKKEDAELYQSMVTKGDVLLVVRSDKTLSARTIFEQTNAKQVREYVIE